MENSSIEWCDHTHNPWTGCTKVSPGCKNCYAEAIEKRFKRDRAWGPGRARFSASAAKEREPFAWDKRAEKVAEAWGAHVEHCREFDLDPLADWPVPPHRPRVFCGSMCDWLDEEASVDDRVRLLDRIRRTPRLDWLLLSKRPEQWRERMDECFQRIGGWLADRSKADLAKWLGNWIEMDDTPPNVWIGTSVEDQTRANLRIPTLLDIPARIRFLSCEPLLEGVNLHHVIGRDGQPFDALDPFKADSIDWVIAGGESGKPPVQPRLCGIDWLRDLRDQCAAARVPYFCKQLGSWAVWPNGDKIRLHHAKGGDPAEWPEDLRVREFPTTGLVLDPEAALLL